MLYIVECIRNMYDPWEKPKLAFYKGQKYYAHKGENGSWRIQSTENHKTVPISAENFPKVFKIVSTKKESRRSKEKDSTSRPFLVTHFMDIMFITTYLTNFAFALSFGSIHQLAISWISDNIPSAILGFFLGLVGIVFIYINITKRFDNYYPIFCVVEILIVSIISICLFSFKTKMMYAITDIMLFSLILHKMACGDARAKGISYTDKKALDNFATAHNIAATISVIIAVVVFTTIFRATEFSFSIVFILGVAFDTIDNAICALRCIGNYTIDISKKDDIK